jgi:CRISPR-associated endonuclease/helicase Cas3
MDTKLLRDALGGQEPFPWQCELLWRFCQNERVEFIDLPTGLGKTAVMAIWLVARASGAKLPRRLVYIVDRRAVVDQATDVALRLREWVDGNAKLKQALGLSDRSLPISTLRGQYVDNREWLEDPSAPAIIIGTVDMIGSRLLFEGYGVSRKLRPYHAGLLGADSLVVLDEAHLVPPFEHLLRAIASDSGIRPPNLPVPRFHVLALSATARRRGGNAFSLTENDRKHPVVSQRLTAKKWLRIAPLAAGDKLQDALAEYAWQLTDEGQKAVRVLVYADSREVAQKAREALERLAGGGRRAGRPAIDTELLVGGRRVFEREEAKKRLEELGFIAGSHAPREWPAFLFATSAGEVGVDLDADHMVCDLVAWERMVQRLGRVNRRGEPAGQVAHIVVVVESEPKDIEDLLAVSPDRLTDKERKTVDRVRRQRASQRALEKLPLLDVNPNGDRVFDASPGALEDLRQRAAADVELQKILDEATTPEPLRPALTRPLIEAWAMTSLEQHPGRPLVQPWLRGWVDDPPQTAVVWRKYLPVRSDGTFSPGEIEAFFEAAPPHTSEILETETFVVLQWLIARAESVRKQQTEAQPETETARPPLREQDLVAFVLEPDGTLHQALTLAEIASLGDRKNTKDKENFSKSLEWRMLILDARLAGLKHGLLDEQESSLPRTADDGQEWLAEGAVGFRVRRVEAGTAPSSDLRWRERFRLAVEVNEEGEAARWLVVEKWRSDAATEEDRSASRPQLLCEHQDWTEKRARALARRLGLQQRYEELLALAARLHDEGKRARRWQQAFNAPAGDVYAKTEGPIDYRLLAGYRHELGSLLKAENHPCVVNLPDEDRDLLLHLIAAHHGYARPVIGTSGCEDAPPSALDQRAAEIALRFARLQKRWGPWGLAWWEALLRAADQQASRDNDAFAGVRKKEVCDGTGFDPG